MLKELDVIVNLVTQDPGMENVKVHQLTLLIQRLRQIQQIRQTLQIQKTTHLQEKKQRIVVKIFQILIGQDINVLVKYFINSIL